MKTYASQKSARWCSSPDETWQSLTCWCSQSLSSLRRCLSVLYAQRWRVNQPEIVIVKKYIFRCRYYYLLDQPLAQVSHEGHWLPSLPGRLEIIKLHSIQVTSYQWSIATSSGCFYGSKINYWVDCLLQLDGWLFNCYKSNIKQKIRSLSMQCE